MLLLFLLLPLSLVLRRVTPPAYAIRQIFSSALVYKFGAMLRPLSLLATEGDYICGRRWFSFARVVTLVQFPPVAIRDRMRLCFCCATLLVWVERKAASRRVRLEGLVTFFRF